MLVDPTYASFSHRHHSYRRRGFYAEQLRRFTEALGEDQVLVVDSDKFFTEPAQEYPRIIDFLGLRPHLPATFDQWNARPGSPMSDGARRQLSAAFEPHDAELEQLLGHAPSWRRYGGSTVLGRVNVANPDLVMRHLARGRVWLAGAVLGSVVGGYFYWATQTTFTATSAVELSAVSPTSRTSARARGRPRLEERRYGCPDACLRRGRVGGRQGVGRLGTVGPELGFRHGANADEGAGDHVHERDGKGSQRGSQHRG